MTNPFYTRYLKNELNVRLEKNPRYSLRAFARSLDINAGALSQILSGDRHPSFKMAEKIVASLSLSPEERSHFFESLTLTQKGRNLKRLSKAFQNKISSSINQKNFATRELTLEYFKVIADWYNLAILEMTTLPNFKPIPASIARRLGISELEAKLALGRLQELELIETVDNSVRKAAGRLTLNDKTLTTPALKRRQKQILEKSIYSLENDPIEIRNHSAITMAINPAKIGDAKKKILEFSRELCSFLQDGKESQVYEMQVSLFPLTKGETS